jgi:hypothetical protein
VLRARERASTPYSLVAFSFGLSFESFKELGARQYELQFLFFFQMFYPKNIFFESFKWDIIHMDFVGFPFRTSKLKNNIKCKNFT